MAESPCATCSKADKCIHNCAKHKQWFKEEWKKIRQFFMGVKK